MLASDVNNTQFMGAKDPDAALIVQFYLKPVQNNVESSKAGRPIFEDVIYVKINVPGVKESEWDMPAREDHKARFPRQWQHFVNQTQGDAREVGTPLQEWAALTRSQVEEFRALKFFTVESIANSSDLNINQLGMIGGMSPYVLRDKARAFLQSAKDAAFPQHQAEELAKRDARIAALEEQIARIASAQPQSPVASTPPPVTTVKRGPGRPRKDEVRA